jgi:hypothetical protein
MKESGLLAIAAQLKDEETRLRARMEGLRRELQEVAANVRRVSRAAAALQKMQSATKPRQKAAVGKRDVVHQIVRVLRERDVLEVDALRHAVEDRVRGEGKSLTGFALRFKEALCDEQFEKRADGYRLSERASLEHAGA